MKIFLSVPMPSVMCLQFSMQEKGILEPSDAQRHTCIL